MEYIDLRSDTVTKPSPAMREAMATAEVGDDVWGEDPTVICLETMAADMLGMEAGLFVTSGTQGNLLALLTHCQRGDEYIVGQNAHTYKYEGGGAAIIGSIQPQPLDFEKDGTIDLNKVALAIKPDDPHFARTKLLCLENTHWGRVIPLDYLAEAAAFAKEHNLQLHLDGARIFNASVKLQVPVTEISRHFDSVSICLSKGLGAPIGSILCAGREQIKEARRWRKILGSGMRQVGIIAAAGIYSLENNIDRLAKDHENAELLAKGLEGIEGLEVDHDSLETNIFYITIDKAVSPLLTDYLKQRGILIYGSENIRIVTHMDLSREDIKAAIGAFRNFFSMRNN